MGRVTATPRERTEEIERQTLAPHATLAAESKGRERDEEHDALRTSFQRDRDRIVHSKSFRRLKHKTQVFLAPEGDHYRVRLTRRLCQGSETRNADRRPWSRMYEAAARRLSRVEWPTGSATTASGGRPCSTR